MHRYYKNSIGIKSKQMESEAKRDENIITNIHQYNGNNN